MHFEHILRAGALVQVIDILGNDRLYIAQLLQCCQAKMRRVGLCIQDDARQTAHPMVKIGRVMAERG